MSDDDEIERFLKERGATKCPTKAAAVLGESRPGVWREAERRAEQSKYKWRREALQKRLARRYERKDG